MIYAHQPRIELTHQQYYGVVEYKGFGQMVMRGCAIVAVIHEAIHLLSDTVTKQCDVLYGTFEVRMRIK